MALLNSAPPRADGRVVIYWMQQTQRAEDNHALEAAIALANELNTPVVALFVLQPGYPGANLRHYTFMLEGLRTTAARLRGRGVGWATMLGDPVTCVPEAVRQLHAAALITDRGYLRHQRRWRAQIAAELSVQMLEVDTDCVIPCTLFPKEEYAARTLRPKYRRLLPEFLTPIIPLMPRVAPPTVLPRQFDVDDLPATLQTLHTDLSVPPSVSFCGGAVEAERRLDNFIHAQLPRYREDHADAAGNSGSHLSAYLHYGQLSPLRVALQVSAAGATDDLSVQSYLDELLIRRELSINFAWYNEQYDTPAGWPAWARQTLDAHRADPRQGYYSRAQLAAGDTDDALWNATQHELLAAGEIHNYARMLWAKKLLQWTECAEDAWDIAVYLNDRYALDGRDASGYTGIAWCLAGKHDRPWPSRPIYGTVRYMATGNAGKHFNVRGYLARVEELSQQANITEKERNHGTNDQRAARHESCRH